MTSSTVSSPDPTLAIAERQLAMLGELAEIAMAAARAYGESALATAKAEKEIVSEPWFTPEIGRARACGAKEASESLQKAARAVRLTLVLEMNLAEIVRDLRAGKITYIGGIAHRKDAGETPAVQVQEQDQRRQAAGSDSRDADPRSRDRNTERLFEFDRPDRLFHPAFRDTVERIRADVGAAVDWSHPERPNVRPIHNPPSPEVGRATPASRAEAGWGDGAMSGTPPLENRQESRLRAQPPPGSWPDATVKPSPLRGREDEGCA